MATMVLVPGAYHGDWYFSPIVEPLRAAGHEVHSITLSGLGGASARLPGAINLDTHIADLVDLIEQERLTDILLCGHSYGGMVIAGAAARLPGRVRTLVFLDALVPADGDSVWSLWPRQSRDQFIAASADGLRTGPPAGLDPRARAHPLATFLQPITLTGTAYAVPNKLYAWCSGQDESPFAMVYDRLSADSAWVTRRLACGHDIIGEAPDMAAALLLEVAGWP